MIALFVVLVYISLNLMNTAPLHSINTITGKIQSVLLQFDYISIFDLMATFHLTFAHFFYGR